MPLEPGGLEVRQFVSRWLEPVRVILLWLLVIALAFVAARLIWLVLAPTDAVARPLERPLPSPSQVSEVQTVVTNRTSLVEQNPFSAKVEAEQVAAPETQLNLQLAGLFAEIGGDGGSAQIRTPDNTLRRYSVGDEIIPGVMLEQLLSDRAIIRRNGIAETLMLGGRSEGLSVISSPDTIKTDPGQAGRGTPDPAAGPASAGSIEDPDVLLRNTRLQPVLSNGQMTGYRVIVTGDKALIEKSGLQNEDILLEVNGTPVSELDMQELLSELGANQTAVLNLDRSGRRVAVRLSYKE